MGTGMRGRKLLGRDIDRVLTAFKHVKLGVNRLFESFGFVPKNVLRNDRIAGANDGIVRLRGDDQSESLQIGGDIDLAFAALARKDFPEIDWAAFRSNCPQYISEVLASKAAGRLQVVELCADGKPPGFPVDFGMTSDRWHKVSAPEINHRGTAAMTIVDCLGGAGEHVHAKHWHILA